LTIGGTSDAEFWTLLAEFDSYLEATSSKSALIQEAQLK
jgi:hypothetical protein